MFGKKLNPGARPAESPRSGRSQNLKRTQRRDPGRHKFPRGLARTASVLALIGLIGVGAETSANAAVITSQVGTPAATGSGTLGGTLTQGFIDSDWGWSHVYGAITAPILSVTLTIDLIDAEDPEKRLDLYAGADTGGAFIGKAYGQNDGSPGPWLGLGDSSDNVITLDSSFHADLADGTFDIFGDNQGMWAWGSNRALLTITTEDLDPLQIDPLASIPEPATLALFGLGLAGFGFSRRKRTE